MSYFVRKIGAERSLLMLPLNVVMVGRVTGMVGPDRVSSALENLRSRHKQLAVRVRFDDDGSGWYEGENVPSIPVSVDERLDDETWLARVLAEFREPFPLETGPLIRCALVLTEDQCDIVLTGHHAICDGTSMGYLLRDLLRALADPDAPIDALPSPPPIDNTTVPSTPRSGPVMRWIMGAMNRKWASEKLRFGEAEMRGMHEVFWKKNAGVQLVAWEMEEKATNVLVTRCREEQVTVNSALWAAFLAAQEEVQTDPQGYRQRSGLAISTRDKLNTPVGEALGFYASSLTVKLPKSSRQPFWDAARQAHRVIKKSIANTDLFRMLMANEVHPTLLDALYFEKYGLLHSSLARKLLRKMTWHKVTYGYAITNVGRLDIPTAYGALELTSVYGPCVYSDVDEKVVGAVTVGGRLTLTLSCNEAVVGQGTAEKLKTAAERRLREAVKNR